MRGFVRVVECPNPRFTFKLYGFKCEHAEVKNEVVVMCKHVATTPTQQRRNEATVHRVARRARPIFKYELRSERDAD